MRKLPHEAQPEEWSEAPEGEEFLDADGFEPDDAEDDADAATEEAPAGPVERRAGPLDAGLRLDQYWARELTGQGFSRERIKEWIQAGLALVEGKACRKAGQRLEGRERLLLDAPDLGGLPGVGAPEAEDAELAILHRDAFLAVVSKPAGLTTHPCPSQPAGTLVNRLLHHFPEMAPELSGMEGERPGIVHRLDKDTSGLMLAALTEGTRLALSAAFAAREVRKTYLALVHGRPEGDATGRLGPDAGFIDLPIGRHPSLRTRMAVLQKGGRDARTGWRRLWTDRLGRASLLAVDLHTGRTHQIRVHLAHVGHPLLGDPVYGPARHAAWRTQPGPLAGLAPRQMLHAFRLVFRHPETGEVLRFRQDPPEDFLALAHALAADCQRVVLTGMPGCGKSALLRALSELPGGPPTFSADACVAGLYAPGADGAAMLARALGREILAPDGAVDRPQLLRRMLEEPRLRREVEGVVHPLVRHALEEFWRAHQAERLAVAEIPLFFESGFGGKAALADVTVGLRSPEGLRRGPWREARGVAPEALAAFESWQWPEERKLAACDLVVENGGSLEDLRAGAATLLERLAGLRRERAEHFGAHLAEALDRTAERGAGVGPDGCQDEGGITGAWEPDGEEDADWD